MLLRIGVGNWAIAMQSDEKKVWFPAKRYGWGWGLPCRWQGWVVFLTYLVLAVGGLSLLAKEHLVLLGIAYVWVLSIGLIIICFLKGEKPRWRWEKQ